MKDNGSTKYDLLIERLCETFGALYQGVIIDKTWLCERFGIAERTAYRDLARLAHVLDEVSSGRYKLTASLLPSLHTGHLAEFANFAGVAHLFPHHDGHSLRKRMNNADNIAIHGASSRENQQYGDLMNSLDKAITARTEVTCFYREKSRRLQPYRLINHYGLWYLAAVEQGCLKSFELARIAEFSPTQIAFEPDASVIEELDTTPGIRFGKRTDVTLHVSAHAATFVTRRPLFPAQRLLKEHQDGSITITTAISDQNTLFRWLRYWLPDIRIVAPVTLDAAFMQDLQARCEPITSGQPQDA